MKPSEKLQKLHSDWVQACSKLPSVLDRDKGKVLAISLMLLDNAASELLAELKKLKAAGNYDRQLARMLSMSTDEFVKMVSYL